MNFQPWPDRCIVFIFHLLCVRTTSTYTFSMAQNIGETVGILRSLKSVKSVNCEANATLWGEDFAASSDKAKYKGIIDRWFDNKKDALMIKWEGYTRCQKTPLTSLDTDAAGDSVEFTLLPYDDGTVPKLVERPAAGTVDVDPDDDEEDPSDDEDPAVTSPAVTISVTSNGQVWKQREPTAVKVDRRTLPRTKPSLNSGGADLSEIEALFYFLLPPEIVDLVITWTNPLLSGADKTNAKLTRGEVKRFMGYMLCLSIHSGIALDKMWSKVALPDSTMPAPAMGRFGISKNRFDKLRSVFRCGPSDDLAFSQNEWCFVEPLLDAFNSHNIKQIIPGWLLGPDESIGAWRGKEGKKDPKKCPKRMFVKRKPEPLGVEFKNIGDALSGMMLKAEITKGKAENIKPKYWSKENGATAATTMRLSEPWFGTGRVVAGDSWFASVRTTELLLKNGLDFIGDIKTGTKRFVPKTVYDAGTEDENGAWATWTSEIKLDGDTEVPIYCVTHRRGESIHAFIASCGTTLPGNSHVAYFEDDEDRAMGVEVADFELTRKCPMVLNDFTLAQPTIDRHNRYRQHILAMEKRLVTNNFSFRFFTTVLGFIVVNAFLAHRYFNDANADFKSLMDRLALKLMNNPDAESPTTDSSPSNGRKSPADSSEAGDHHLMHLKHVEGITWKPGLQQRCVMCNAKTVWVCAECSDGPTALVPLCSQYTCSRAKGEKGSVTQHKCLELHSCRPSFFPRGGKTPAAKCGCKRSRMDGEEGA